MSIRVPSARPLLVLALAIAGASVAVRPASAQPQSAFARAVELSTAASTGDLRTVERILAAGHDPDTPLGANRTPLMSAAGAGRLEAVKLLLAKGADPLLEDDSRKTAREYAAAWGHTDVARLLEAAERGQPLPDIRANTSGKPNFEQAVALNGAAMTGDLDEVRRILATQQDPNFLTGAGAALHAAASYGRLEIVRVLLAAGADPTLRDGSGRTPLDRARAENHRDVVNELLRAQGLPPEGPRRRQPPTDAPAPAPAPATPAAPAAAAAPAVAGPTEQLAPDDFAPTGVTPRGGVWEGRVTNGAGLVRFTVSPDGRSVSDVEFEGDIRCSDTGAGMGGAYGRSERADWITRDGAAFVVTRGAFNGTYHDRKAGVHWAPEGHFVSATTARGKVRIGAHSGRCDTWGLQWTARRVR